LVLVGAGARAVLAGIALSIPGAVSRCRSIQIAEVAASAPYPARLEGSRDPNLSRWMWLVKSLLAVPHHVVLFVMWVAFLTIAAGFLILLSRVLRRAINRWVTMVGAPVEP